MNYSPVLDQVESYGLVAIAAVLLVYELLATLYWRRVAKQLKRSGRWGGE